MGACESHEFFGTIGADSWSRDSLLRTAASTAITSSYAATRTQVGCGDEPARRPPDALGVARYVDLAAGSKYDACISAAETARTKAIYDKVIAKQAGPVGGCGPEPPFVANATGIKMYTGGRGDGFTGEDLGKAWAACMGYGAAAAAPAPAVSAPAAAPPLLVSAVPRTPATSTAYIPAGGQLPGYPAPSPLVASRPQPFMPSDGALPADLQSSAPAVVTSAASSLPVVPVAAGAGVLGLALLYLLLR